MAETDLGQRAHADAADSSTYAYERIAADLCAKIESGEYPPGSVLPSEAQLVATYDSSRTTVRKAVGVLARRGLVTVSQGRPPIVRQPAGRPSRTHQRAIQVTAGQWADADTEAPEWTPVEPPRTHRLNADATIALNVGVAEFTPLFVTERLLANRAGQRLFHRLYLPMSTALEVPELAEDNYPEPGKLYRLLAAAGLDPQFTDYVTAQLPVGDQVESLKVPDATPILTTRRVIRTATSRALAMEETHRSANDTQLAYQVRPII